MPVDTHVGEYMDKRSKNGTAGYPTQKNIWRSVMAAWAMDGRRITGVQLYPISLGMRAPRTFRGTPVLTQDDETLRYLAQLSKPFGTDIRIQDGVGYIDL